MHSHFFKNKWLKKIKKHWSPPQAPGISSFTVGLNEEASTLIVPVVVSLINLIVPLAFSLINTVEHYTNPRTNIYIGIMRSAL